MDAMHTEMGRPGFNNGKLLRASKGSNRARRYTGGKNSHKWQLLLEETLDSLLSIWTTPIATQGPSATQLAKLVVATPCPKTTAEMLVAGGHILRVPDDTNHHV